MIQRELVNPEKLLGIISGDFTYAFCYINEMLLAIFLTMKYSFPHPKIEMENGSLLLKHISENL